MSHAVEILLGRLYHLGVNYFSLEASFMITSPETTSDTDANVTQSLKIKERNVHTDLCVCVCTFLHHLWSHAGCILFIYFLPHSRLPIYHWGLWEMLFLTQVYVLFPGIFGANLPVTFSFSGMVLKPAVFERTKRHQLIFSPGFFSLFSSCEINSLMPTFPFYYL